MVRRERGRDVLIGVVSEVEVDSGIEMEGETGDSVAAVDSGIEMEGETGDLAVIVEDLVAAVAEGEISGMGAATMEVDFREVVVRITRPTSDRLTLNCPLRISTLRRGGFMFVCRHS
jgi:hypothetical protein